MSTTKFLQRELKALPRFVRRHGPLPAPKAPGGSVVLPNPFLPWRNPKTGRWAPPKYSLRQQADLVKQAKATGTLHLLPPSIKLVHPELLAPAATLVELQEIKGKEREKENESTPIKRQVKVRKGVTVEWDRRPKERIVPGADIGTRLYAKKQRMFKGSRLERGKEQRQWRTWVLLRDMRKRIRRYRNSYVHRKPNPLKPARGTQKKLPF
ncbi:hypothetical protein C8F01DRAFT_1219532 [Mycena amicta]|nr:hypothetical protein C8F01DRAFT_1219532 [Mycena amicta]